MVRGPDRIMSYLTKDWKKCLGDTESIKSELLELAGFDDLRSFISEVSKETISLTFFAGGGARWIDSINNLNEEDKCRFNSSLPRCVAPVKNVILSKKDVNIPVGIYNLGAVRNIAKNVIIYNRNREIIQRMIADYLNTTPIYVEQTYSKEDGRPLGHGDAALQSIGHLEDSKFIITNFCGDSNSKKTIALTLLAMYVMEKYRCSIDLILPTTLMENPKYPVLLSKKGYPVYFSQSKLKGDKPTVGKGASNIGVRVYRTESFIKHLKDYQAVFKKYGSYASINNGNNELALDNIDEAMAKENKAVTFCIALPEEIAPVKTVTDIPLFEKAMVKILERDRSI